MFLSVAARTVLVDPDAAEAYLARLHHIGGWLDQISQRLRAGAASGRLPVAPLAEQAVSWAEGVLAAPGSSPVLAPRPPEGWPLGGGLGRGTPGRGLLGRAPGAGPVGGHGQGTAATGPADRPGRAGLPARR